jgi:hypothetical protein
MNNLIIKNALINAASVFTYIVLVASFFFNIQTFFGANSKETVLIPIVMLMLLVFSVALVGSLIFGRPILWYLDGKKQEAVLLLTYTLGVFFILLLIAFLVLYFVS